MSTENFTMLMLIILLSGVILGFRLNRPQQVPQPYMGGGYHGYENQSSGLVLLVVGFLVFILLTLSNSEKLLDSLFSPPEKAVPKPIMTPLEASASSENRNKETSGNYILELGTYDSLEDADAAAASLSQKIDARIGYYLTNDNQHVLYVGPYTSVDLAHHDRELWRLSRDEAVVRDAGGLELY